MSYKKFNKDGYLFDSMGSPVVKLKDEINKYYAVIAKCGHCGSGYFIPIIFPIHCKDINTAIEVVKEIPRVKRYQKDVIIDAFETSGLENMFLEVINQYDPYLRGFLSKDDAFVDNIRIIEPKASEKFVNENSDLSEDEIKSSIKTAEYYGDKYVLQRYYAPIIQGKKLVYPNRINIRQMLDEYFYYAAIRGLKRHHNAFISLYYQLYGEDNALGLSYDNGWINFRGENGKLYSISLPEIYDEKIRCNEFGIAQGQNEEIINFDEEDMSNIPSALERFNSRMKKHQEKIQTNTGSQPGDC